MDGIENSVHVTCERLNGTFVQSVTVWGLYGLYGHMVQYGVISRGQCNGMGYGVNVRYASNGDAWGWVWLIYYGQKNAGHCNRH